MGGKRPKRRLIEGRNMRCPRCKRPRDVLAYTPMKMIEEFIGETTPIYKCPDCSWMFAPADPIVIDTAPLLEEVAV
jgi:rubredoxin